ncbi:MAG: GldG family protein [Desulfobacteraceae bacterium]|nr:GldG family protein [Desulfobacteraceae bacterium]
MPANPGRNRKWVYGSNTIISSIIFLGILIFVILIAERHPLRVDLTDSGSFSLSEQTRNILKDLKQPVSIKCFYSAAAPDQAEARTKAKDLLDTYRYHSENIKYEMIDPDAQPDIARRYEVKNYGTLVVEGFGRKQVIQTADEETVTNALLKVIRQEPKKIYFLTGHGEHSLAGPTRESFANAKTAMEKNYYSVAEFNLLQQPDIPGDAAAVVIAGPMRPVPEAEQQILRAYLQRGGKVFLMVDPLAKPGLKDFLDSYGIEITDDVVVDRLSRVFGASERIPVVVEYGPHKITAKFTLPTLFPDARSVVPSPKAIPGVRVEVLASTSQNAWAERNMEMLNRGEAAFDRGSDLEGPVPLVVVATIGAQEDGAQADAAGKKPAKEGVLVVSGDSDFASDSYFALYGNSDLFLNIVSFLADDANLIAIEHKTTANKPMLLTQDQAQAMFWIVLILVPLAVLVAGLTVYRVRRAQR